MSLRRKIMLFLSMISVGLLVILFAISQTILIDSYSELEERAVVLDAHRVTSALEGKLATMDTTNYDWAAWDDTYNFIIDGNEEYIESNLVDSTFTILSFNVMLYINNEDEVVYAKAVDLETGEEIPLPQGFISHIMGSEMLLHHIDVESSVGGFITLAEGPMLVSSRPILTSNDEGPIHGTMVVGRFLDEKMMADISHMSHLSLAVEPFPISEMPSDFQVVASSLSTGLPVMVQPVDENIVAGYVLVEDIYGQPALILRLDIERDIYNQGHQSIAYLILSMVAACVLFGGMTAFVMEKSVLSRVSRLSRDIAHIGASSDASARVLVEGGDEISSLAEDINSTLNSLEKARRKVERSNAELEQFASVVSHDMREPVRMVKSYLGLLEKRTKGSLDEKSVSYLEYAKDGATRMQAMISDILALARLDFDEKPFKKVDLGNAVGMAINNMEVAISESGAEISIDKMPFLLADELQMTQLFQNLIGNAIKFRGSEPLKVNVSARKNRGEWMFCVKDNGLGIENKHSERIFNVFQRIHNNVEIAGNGIGLAVCRKIVERHGGRIWVESEPNKGSRFYFTIPMRGG